MVTRAAFVLGTASACSGIALANELPTRFVRSGVDRIDLAMARKRADFNSGFVATLEIGTLVFAIDALMITDGETSYAFPAGSIVRRTARATEIAVAELRQSFSVSRRANLRIERNVGLRVVNARAALDDTLKSDVRTGFARFLGKKLERPLMAAPATSKPDNSGGGGSTSTFGQMLSGNNSCQGNAENVGFSFNVPNTFYGNVTATICINNGTTNACFRWPNFAPGSSHNVSAYISGLGQPINSLGFITSNGGVFDGYGSADLRGC